ncbi:hypothetical protein [Paraglaciecola marina]|uniref:hypothetical protein n=1 Tax=Paraglaciecola marina TaxID=2500157 RepID=UPI0010615383|nr:hypothetical protein [Paraglaciecola marina]
MVKLSQRAWNNVIIVSMLALIMLFNLSSNFLNDDSHAPALSTLVPQGLLISTIEFSNAKVERVGQGWRVESDLSVSKDLKGLIDLWQSAEVSPFEENLQRKDSQYKVTVWFIGQAEPTEYLFLTLADKTLVKIGQQTYQLVNVNYQTLIPTE